jgi:hypothetical protein
MPQTKQSMRSVARPSQYWQGMLAGSVNELEGSECGTINPEVAHKFFDIDASKDVLRRRAAQNICARCIVQPECLQLALYGPMPPRRGIVAGLAAGEILRARSWLRYELGGTDQVPKTKRPEWLPFSEAADAAEVARMELDEVSL